MYFNVPGAIIKPGKKSYKLTVIMAQIILFINQFVAFAVYDVMRRLKCPIITINTGLTVGMGALLCSVGSPGQRSA